MTSNPNPYALQFVEENLKFKRIQLWSDYYGKIEADLTYHNEWLIHFNMKDGVKFTKEVYLDIVCDFDDILEEFKRNNVTEVYVTSDNKKLEKFVTLFQFIPEWEDTEKGILVWKRSI